jgi:quercetin dioxygenase-like cupin family protein
MNPTNKSNPLVSLPMPFADERGAIQTLVNGDVESVQIITSKKGTVRANHYHKEDSHNIYVIAGSLRYYCRPVGSAAKPNEVVVLPGQMIFTGPLVEHAVLFLEDCTFINMASKSREQAAYEADLVRVELIAPGPHK